MFLYPYKEEFDSVNNRNLTNGYDIIVTTTYCDFKKVLISLRMILVTNLQSLKF